MTKFTILEFFVRVIPETFLFIFATYVFAKVKLDLRRYLISGITLAIVGIITRALPIHNGVHTILNVFALIIIAVNINKIDMIKSIQIGVIIVILQFICEAINVLLIQYIFRADVINVFKNPTLKTIYGIPSTLIFFIIIIIYYFKVSKGKEMKKESNGKISA